MEKATSVELCLMHSLLYELQNYHTAGFEERWKLEEQEKETVMKWMNIRITEIKDRER